MKATDINLWQIISIWQPFGPAHLYIHFWASSLDLDTASNEGLTILY